MIYNQLLKIIDKNICTSNVYSRFLERLNEGNVTRDENQESHFCVYFLPYNKRNKKVFVVHHKKANKWLSPGGHIDRGEGLLGALNREIDEELGVEKFFKSKSEPFLLTITLIENQSQPCKEHLDIWYLMETDGRQFKVDPREFYDTKWMTIEEAKSIITDQPNLRALNKIEETLLQ